MVVCKLDNTQHESVEAMHKHLRPLMKQENYYRQFMPKVDLYTGEPIPFKNSDQYLAQDFLTKDNIRAFLKSRPIKGKEWAINWLKKRKEDKGLKYAPSQVELRSLDCPTMAYYDYVGDYYQICRSLGFEDRYKHYPVNLVSKVSGFTLIEDTREQNPVKLGIPTVRAKLNCGDYGLMAPHDAGVYVERKSLTDFIGTLNQRTTRRVKKDMSVTEDSSFDRFDRELSRATDAGSYIIMIVESNIEDSLTFDDNDMRRSRVSSSHVFYNLRTLLTKYPLNFQAVFVDGREEAARVMLKIFGMGSEVKKYDLQHAYEKGSL